MSPLINSKIRMENLHLWEKLSTTWEKVEKCGKKFIFLNEFNNGMVNLIGTYEGKADAKDFPEFATETGYKPAQKHFIDNIVYDGTQPNAYLEKFKIGLKGDTQL